MKKFAYFYITFHNSTKSYISSPDSNRTCIKSLGNFLAGRQTRASPKLNFIYSKSNSLQCFLKLGKGFHSNDTRVITAQTSSNILPTAYCADAGLIWKPVRNLVVNSALWYLYMQQEFVYVGDEGIVEPGGRTERKGIDLGLRYQLG